MPACPPLQALERLAAGEEDEASRAHLASCGACRDVLARLREHGALAELVRAVRDDAVPAFAAEEPIVAGYEIQEEIHRGGQGVVYRAVQRSTKRVVAVKVLLEGAFVSPRKLRRFEREVELAANLEHPNIVTVHDSGTTADGRRYFVMEHVDGVPANGMGDRDLEQTLTLFAKICDAVHFAHQRGVLHRDLKPGNILIDERREPHVLDFGMAVSAGEAFEGEATRLTLSGEFMGTLAYASPEHVRGHPAEIDVRSDVYALGVILYEMLTGELPYPVEGGFLEVARAIAEREPRSATGVLGPHGGELDTIVRKALAKEKERRYQSAAALARDVRHHLAGEPIDARRDSTWYVVRKALARNRLPSAMAACLLLVLVAAAVVATVLWRRSVDEAQRAQRQAAKATELSGFFQEMMLGGTPHRARGRAVSVSEMLERAARDLEREPLADPEAEMELRHTIGSTYLALDLPRSALVHLDRAADLAAGIELDDVRRARNLVWRGHARSRLSPSAAAEADLLEARRLLAGSEGEEAARLSADALALLARLSLRLGRMDEAEERYRGARAVAARTFGDPSLEVANATVGFATLLYERGELARAEELHREALELLRRLGLADTPSAAIVMRRQGQALEAQGRLGDALEQFSAAHALRELLLGPTHPSVVFDLVDVVRATARAKGQPASEPLYRRLLELHPVLLETRGNLEAEALNNLGVVAFDRGEWAFAERVQRASVALYEELFEHVSLDQAVARGNLAWTLVRRGRGDEAEGLCYEALEAARAQLGPGTAFESRLLAQLAWIHVASGAYHQAIDEAEEALALRRDLLGEEHRDVAAAWSDLGWFRYVGGAYAEAEEALLRALAITEPIGASGAVETARARHTLGFVRLDQRRLADAESLFRAALETRRRLLAADHPDVAESMNALGLTLYFGGGAGDEVAELWNGALEILRAQGESYPRTAWVLGNLGKLHRDRGDLDGAERYLDECLAHARRTAAANHPLLAINLANRAALHRTRGEDAEAEPLLEESYRILLELRGPEDPQVLQVLGHLIGVYESLGKEEEAARHRALLPG